MEIPVLLEPVAGNGYRARGIEPFGLCAEGATREEALGNLREKLQARFSSGAELVTLEISPQQQPWKKFAGMFKDDPDFQEVLEIMAENRRKMDEDPDIP